MSIIADLPQMIATATLATIRDAAATEIAKADLPSQVESAFVRCRREYLALHEAIHQNSDFDIDIAYGDYCTALRQYLRLVSVRLYLPMRGRRQAGGGHSTNTAYLNLARANMLQAAEFFRFFQRPEARKPWRLLQDLEKLDKALQRQYRWERSEILPGRCAEGDVFALVA